MDKTPSMEEINAAIDKSFKLGIPIMIDYLDLINVDRHFSEKEIEKRRLRKQRKQDDAEA